MYSIGEFSKINRITPKTLRHYDKIGLLKPVRIDEWTGYRYYSPQQLPIVRSILMLKEMGFSLTEIQQITKREAAIGRFLERRAQEIREVIRQENLRLSRVLKYLEQLEGGDIVTTEDVTIKALAEVTVVSMRCIVESYDSYFDIVPRMGEYMTKIGAVCREPAYCFIIYHNDEYRESDIDVEICEAVTEPCEDSQNIRFKTVAAVPEAACILHRGPYSTIQRSYSAVFNWIDGNGYRPIDHTRESYIDGIWNREDPDHWLTEIQVPVEKQERREGE